MSQTIRCQCGKFKAELTEFPRATPGRLKCYCDDCQQYLVHLERTDLLDAAGGSEVIPTYPANMKVLSGSEHLKCTRLSPKGMFRWSTTCCNSPVANTSARSPWIGVMRNMYTADDAQLPERTLGEVRSSIFGRYATGVVPPGTADKVSFRAIRTVLPFLLKGIITRKSTPSPFFKSDGKTPILEPTVLSSEQRSQLAETWKKRHRPQGR
jgi:hypothetical protein